LYAYVYKVGQISFETIFLKVILRAADVSNLKFFKVASLKFFTMFRAFRSLFKTVSEILNRNVSDFILLTDDLLFPTSEKRVSFSALLSSGNSHKSPGAKSGGGGWGWGEKQLLER
jgi:hypothetical protein